MDRTNGVALVFAAIAGLSGSGCLAQMEEESEAFTLREAQSSLEGPNALTPNALTPNALTPNALTPNALTPNALTPNALAPSAMAAIQDPAADGENSRKLLKYTVGCALNTSQSFSFSWTDSAGQAHAETYLGILGLAPAWTSRPLNESEKRWMSACLASRLNWYGTTVMISSRASHKELKKSGSPELTTYTMAEGAFWGDVFSSEPRLFACNYGPNTDHSRSQLRDCAAGHVMNNGSIAPCGIVEIVGDCEDVCDPMTKKNKGEYYPSCTGSDGVSNEEVITTFLM